MTLVVAWRFIEEKIDAASPSETAPSTRRIERAVLAVLFVIAITAAQAIWARYLGGYILDTINRGTVVVAPVYQTIGLVAIILTTLALRPSDTPVPTRGGWLLLLAQLGVGIGVYAATILRLV